LIGSSSLVVGSTKLGTLLYVSLDWLYVVQKKELELYVVILVLYHSQVVFGVHELILV
jgi:hypothetical protein